MRQRRRQAQRLEPAAAQAKRVAGEPGFFLYDSLFLEALASDQVPRAPGQRLGLLAHYLPSLVDSALAGRPWTPSSLERQALQAVDCCLCTGAFMLEALRRAEVSLSSWLLAPGVQPMAMNQAPPPAPVMALMLANVTPGKGLLPLLTALEGMRRPPGFELWVVGRLDVDPDYVQRCRILAQGNLALRDCVHFVGEVPRSALPQWLAKAHCLVSASVMESCGMAMLEARHLGVPILAHDGGNTPEHVREAWGGALCTDVEQLARILCDFAQDYRQRRSRRQRAWTARPEPRPWTVVAQELEHWLERS